MTRRLKQFWYFVRHTTLHGWWVHTRFWWYTTKRERIIVSSILVIVSVSVAIIAQQKIQLSQTRQALFCLALNIYHEARGEPKAGQFAVAEVTMNRVKSTQYPNTVCEVVHQRHWNPVRKRYSAAFSWTQYEYPVNLNSVAWQRAMSIARLVYQGDAKPKLNNALFYHARYVKPHWAKGRKVVARIGQHIFYQ